MPVLYMLLLQQVICSPTMVASLCFINALLKGLLYYDFSLVKNSKNDDKHLFLVQADVQLGKDEDVTAYSEYLRDVKEFVDKCSKYDLFMLDCGDIVGNALSLFFLI